jgi:thiamine-phosphate pyrophosphorylase
MKPIRDCRLYTFVDTAYLNGRDPVAVAAALCEGGSDIVQIRAKGLPPSDVRRLVETVVPVLDSAGVAAVVNDHPEIAMACGAPWVHLGQEDFFDAGHRQVSELPCRRAGCRVGLSTHAPDQCERAILAGADYVAIGPVFATGTKPTARPVTLDYVRWARATVQVPWFAIGGINLTTVDAVVEAGARSICVVSAILNAPDIAAACREFRRRLPD